LERLEDELARRLAQVGLQPEPRELPRQTLVEPERLGPEAALAPSDDLRRPQERVERPRLEVGPHADDAAEDELVAARDRGHDPRREPAPAQRRAVGRALV